MRALLVGLLLIAMPARGEGHSVDDTYVLICRNADGFYFIRPSGIVYAMQGLWNAPSCMAAVDTEGRQHVLCQTTPQPDVCELAEAGIEL